MGQNVAPTRTIRERVAFIPKSIPKTMEDQRRIYARKGGAQMMEDRWKMEPNWNPNQQDMNKKRDPTINAYLR